MAGNELGALDQKIEQMRGEFSSELKGIRSEVKEIVKALQDLVRLDGDIKRIEEALARIGREVDDHEQRLRALQSVVGNQNVEQAVSKKTIGNIDRVVYLAIGSAFTGVVAYLLEHLR